MAYRILSLDGGGMHGFSSVILMSRLFEKHPSFFDKIDLIAGTSIGGIIGLGLAYGHDIKEVEKHFIEGIPYAFNTNWVRLFMFLLGVCPKYDNTPFRRFLIKLFGRARLGDLKKKVVITSFAIDNGELFNRRWKAKMFHNFEGTDSDESARVVDVAMATSSAPVFFKTYEKYIDGAIIANNPSMIALTQTQDVRAIIEPRPTLQDVKILSIGSIRNIYVSGRDLQWGYFNWAKPLVQLISEKDISAVNYQCYQLIKNNFHRLQTIINDPMDEFDKIESIKKTAMDHSIDSTVAWLKENW